MSAVPASLIRWITNRGYAIGVDSIDYGTILPINITEGFDDRIISLNRYTKDQYLINTKNDHGPVVRVFYSLHGVRGTREYLIPKGEFDLKLLSTLTAAGIDVIIHYTFIEGVNDSEVEVDYLKFFMRDHPQYQLRLLRYNTNGKFQESLRFIEIWNDLSDPPNIKYQISPGSNVRAACGMFY